ncbi:GNAT family N-acetyltransferase [Streptomyces sp. NK15101]|uniref:GNAT family N-acetyltransferase n=1 Tax=Streptomyces sp. NK15101 TaxID=2873261 RepID=UPI001CEDC071|nr:GNAT family N-acetyltransferase [Streptomyces sp. NK15101]
MFTPRPFRHSDMPRLQETVAEWIAVAGRDAYDHVGELPHRVYDNLRDGPPLDDLVHVWEHEDDGRIGGVTICLRFGSAFDALCAPELRGGDTERAMLTFAADTTTRHMAEDEEYVLTDLFETDTTRARLLNGLGFTRFRVWDDVNTRDLTGLPAVEVPDGFTVRAATLDDAEALAEARNASFGSGWTGVAYRDGMMTRPGYDPAREIVAEAPDGRIGAYAVHWTDERNGLGHFEPVGTHEAFRRRGLARAVMAESMRRMAELGLRRVTVNHDAENAPAARLYGSLGFTRECRTHGYRRAKAQASMSR